MKLSYRNSILRIKMLFNYGNIYVYILVQYGRTPLQAARENHHEKCVELLLKFDADVLEMENVRHHIIRD